MGQRVSERSRSSRCVCSFGDADGDGLSSRRARTTPSLPYTTDDAVVLVDVCDGEPRGARCGARASKKVPKLVRAAASLTAAQVPGLALEEGPPRCAPAPGAWGSGNFCFNTHAPSRVTACGRPVQRAAGWRAWRSSFRAHPQFLRQGARRPTGPYLYSAVSNGGPLAAIPPRRGVGGCAKSSTTLPAARQMSVRRLSASEHVAPGKNVGVHLGTTCFSAKARQSPSPLPPIA